MSRPQNQIPRKAKRKRGVVDPQLSEQDPADYPIQGLSEAIVGADPVFGHDFAGSLTWFGFAVACPIETSG